MSGKLPKETFEMSSTMKNMTCAPSNSQTDLLNAWRKKDLEGFRVAAQSEDCDPNFLYNNDDFMRMLDRTAEDGFAEYTKIVIQAGADVNSTNPVRSKSPLHFAAENGHLEVLRVLLENGADINVRDSFGSTILHYLAKQKWQPGEVLFQECLAFVLQQDEQLQLNLTNRKGFTAAHLAVNEGAFEALKMLLEKGSKLDLDSYKIGIKKKTAREEIMQKYPQLEKDLPPPWGPEKTHEIKMDSDMLFNLLHNHHEDRFCSKFTQQIKDKAQKHLLSCTDGLYTFLQYSCSEGLSEAVKVLLENEADVNYAPNRSDRPILLACRRGDHKILRLLLDANPDLSPDHEGKNVLHVVSKHSNGSHDYHECLRLLLKKTKESNLDINAQDVKGNSPLHYAVKYGDKKCVFDLLEHGAYIGTLNTFKEPPLANMSSALLGNYLDSCVTWSESSQNDENSTMAFSYKFLIPSACQKKTDAEEVKVPLTDETDLDAFTFESKQPVAECDPLLYMCNSSELRHLLTHPIVTSFILLKWQRIRVFYYVNLLFYLLFCALLTIYILFGFRSLALVSVANSPVTTEIPAPNGSMKIAHDKELSEVKDPEAHPNSTGGHGFMLSNTANILHPPPESPPPDEYPVILLVRILLIIFILVLALREAFQVYIRPRKYVASPENWLEVLLLIVSTFVVVKDCSREFPASSRLGVWCPQFCAVAILISWFELVMLIGRHPLQSLHIEMFKTVSVNFLKFLAWYAFLIIAFALSFYTLFRGCVGECDESNPFTNPGISVFKTIVMLTGEFEAGDIPFISFIGTSHLIFIAFVFLIAIVLFNLLNGLAVTDTQTIRDDAYLYSSIALVKLISHIEKILLGDATPFKLPLQQLSKWTCCRGSSQKKDKTEFVCFEYFAKRIIFFPDLLPKGVIYVLANQNHKIVFSDPKSLKYSSTGDLKTRSCYSGLADYALDRITAKAAEKILAERQSETITMDNKVEQENEELNIVKEKLGELEKKMESLEQSTKQNEKLLIQILAILSLNNANNEER